MGVYDSVFMNCPICGGKIEFQSKAGVCAMREYDTRCPPEIALALDKVTERCEICGHFATFRVEFDYWVE